MYVYILSYMLSFVSATAPGPIIVGFLFDATCTLWQDKCGERGSCWMYDSNGIKLGFTFLPIGLKIMATLFYFLAQFFYKQPQGEKSKKDYVSNGSGITNPAFTHEK